jgi:uncharacterized protein (DUF427 family)
VHTATGRVLARGHDPSNVRHKPDSWYFSPDSVDMESLEVSDRSYTCPRRGICYWVDLRTPSGYVNDVAWVYPDAAGGYEDVAGWFGFYEDHKAYRIELLQSAS